MPTPAKAHKPAASRILLASSSPKSSASPVDHQGAYIAIAVFADAEQSVSPATGALFRHKPQPRRELTAIPEAAPIPDGGNQGGRGHRPDAFNFPKPLAQLADAIQLPDPPIIGCDPAIEFDQFGLGLHHQHTNQRVEVTRGVSRDLGKSSSQPPDVAGDDNAMPGVGCRVSGSRASSGFPPGAGESDGRLGSPAVRMTSVEQSASSVGRRPRRWPRRRDHRADMAQQRRHHTVAWGSDAASALAESGGTMRGRSPAG